LGTCFGTCQSNGSSDAIAYAPKTRTSVPQRTAGKLRHEDHDERGGPVRGATFAILLQASRARG
jgi:hypothetical protein